MAEKITQEAIEQAPDITPEDVLDTEALLEELAQLSLIAYDQCRKDKAKVLARIFHKKAQTSCKPLIEWKV